MNQALKEAIKAEVRQQVTVRREGRTGQIQEAGPDKGKWARWIGTVERTKSQMMANLDQIPPTHAASPALEKGLRHLVQSIALLDDGLKKI